MIFHDSALFQEFFALLTGSTFCQQHHGNGLFPLFFSFGPLAVKLLTSVFFCACPTVSSFGPKCESMGKPWQAGCISTAAGGDGGEKLSLM